MQAFSHVTIEASGYCNARCKWCKTGRKNREAPPVQRYLSCQSLERAVGHLKAYHLIASGCLIDLFNWGEPFLNPELIPIIELLQSNGFRVGLSTNASKYMELPSSLLSGIEYLILSISGFSQESYGRIHGLNLDTVKQNIVRLAEHFSRNGHPGKVIMNFHVYQHNLSEIEAANEFCLRHNICFSPHIAYLADEALFIPYLEGTLQYDMLREASKELLLGLLTADASSPVSFRCPQKDNLVLDEALHVLPCCLFTSSEQLGSLYDFTSIDALRNALDSWRYCDRCLSSGQARIVTSPLLFEYGFKNHSEVTPKIYLGDENGLFSEERTVMGPKLQTGSHFSFSVSLPNTAPVIRLDPLEGQRCSVKNLHVIGGNGEALPVFRCNGSYLEVGSLRFDTLDPQIEILTQKYSHITISGIIEKL